MMIKRLIVKSWRNFRELNVPLRERQFVVGANASGKSNLLESDSVLLLEEPELSLNAGIVSQLAPFISRMQRSRRPQVFVSTHSDALLTEQGIDGREVLLLTPALEGTAVKIVSDIDEVETLLEDGFTVGEVVLPRTRPEHAEQMYF